MNYNTKAEAVKRVSRFCYPTKDLCLAGLYANLVDTFKCMNSFAFRGWQGYCESWSQAQAANPGWKGPDQLKRTRGDGVIVATNIALQRCAWILASREGQIRCRVPARPGFPVDDCNEQDPLAP